MIKKNHIKQNIINIIVFLICATLILCGNLILTKLSTIKNSIKTNIEIEWRLQAKRTLINLQDQFMYDVKHNTVDPLSENSLQEWAKRNISGVLNGGPTGDAFMINLKSEKFIWDGSPDSATDKDRYMKDEYKTHKDQKQAQYIMNKMKYSNGTINTYEKNWWNFDGSTEYLEWVVIPPGFLGFNDETITIGGVKNKEYNKILIALGTQRDEVESTFNITFKTLNIIVNVTKIFITLSVIICIFNMMIYVFLNRRRIS